MEDKNPVQLCENCNLDGKYVAIEQTAPLTFEHVMKNIYGLEMRSPCDIAKVHAESDFYKLEESRRTLELTSEKQENSRLRRELYEYKLLAQRFFLVATGNDRSVLDTERGQKWFQTWFEGMMIFVRE
jgi:hypothetical protein